MGVTLKCSGVSVSRDSLRPDNQEEEVGCRGEYISQFYPLTGEEAEWSPPPSGIRDAEREYRGLFSQTIKRSTSASCPG